jgi:DNA-binding winged helix-turn-helix (wHTH) protein/TolB-like protein
VIRFAEFVANLRSRELFRDGVKVRLPDQSFEVLAILLERPDTLVSREEVRSRLWPSGTFVDFDHGLNNAVKRLREALADSANQPKFIETLPRRGYKFVGNIEPLNVAQTQTVANTNPGILTLSEPPAKIFIRRVGVAATAAGSIFFLITATFLYLRPHPERIPTPPQAIAVLPLQNPSDNKEFDFLRFGLADDIANTLSNQPAFSIRPSGTANKYSGPAVDLQKAAREMRVGNIVTGHFLVSGNRIDVTLEAVNPLANTVVWRDTVQGSSKDLTGLEQQIAARVERGLVTSLGLNANEGPASHVSQNAEAYELYLRALATVDQPQSNGASFASELKQAIPLLQRAVALDPGFASAWATLGHYYYYQIGFDTGGQNARSRARAALQRAVALDPNRIEAATDLINMESEEGRLTESYDDIMRLLHERGNSGAVHLVYAYILWYAGLLGEAGRECDRARFLDPGTTDLASCGAVFYGLGQYDRARAYFQLQSGTEYETGGHVEILIREGNAAEALRKLRSLPPTFFYGRALLEPCLQGMPLKGNKEADQYRSAIMAENDPFPKYLLASWDAYCGEPENASRELARAIEQNYCAYPQMETDPMLTSLRQRPEFAQLRSQGIACQQRFLDHRKQLPIAARYNRVRDWLEPLTASQKSFRVPSSTPRLEGVTDTSTVNNLNAEMLKGKKVVTFFPRSS